MVTATLGFLGLLFYSGLGWTAACCGGSSTLPTLITGDYRVQLSAVGSNSAITHKADPSGNIVKRQSGNKEVREALTLTGAYQLSERWQMGARAPIRFNTYETETTKEQSSGLGDLSVVGSYEFLPEYSFSLWKPRGFAFLGQSIPVSNSAYDSTKPLQTDVISSGFFTTTVGLAFVKAIAPYDFIVMGEYRRGFRRSFENGVSVRPGDGVSLLLGFGWSPNSSRFRYGFGMSYSYFDSNEIQGKVGSAKPSHYLEGSVSVSYLVSENHSLTGSYLDQSFFNVARNTLLTKSLQVSLVRFIDL